MGDTITAASTIQTPICNHWWMCICVSHLQTEMWTSGPEHVRTRACTRLPLPLSLQHRWVEERLEKNKKGLKNSRDKCKTPTAVILRPFASKIHVRVHASALEVALWFYHGGGGSPPRPNTEALCLSAHRVITLCLPAVSHHLPLFLPLLVSQHAWQTHCGSGSMPGRRFTFYRALWHPLISLIPIWYQITDSGGWVARSGAPYRGHAPPWTSLHWGSTVSLGSATAAPSLVFCGCQHFHAVLLFHVDYITASLIALALSLSLSLTHPHTKLICDPFFPQIHFWGYL